MNRYGIVYYNYVECGIIKETEDGFVFTYKKELFQTKTIEDTLKLIEEYFKQLEENIEI